MTNRRSRGTPKKDADWERFLEALRETGIVREACKKSRVGRTTVYEHLKDGGAFKQAFDEAIAESTECLEEVAVHRAKDGSDLLLIFLLKSRRPDIYRDRVETIVKGDANNPLRVIAENVIVKRIERLNGIFDQLASGTASVS